LITEEGDACLGDFGIIRIITDPTIVGREGITTSKPGVTRYMAPELLHPKSFGFRYSSPSEESDVYSFAMTAYQVPYSYLMARIANNTSPHDKVLSGELPYGEAREALTTYRIVSGVRPSRPKTPTADLWLPDPIWDAIRRCWIQEPQLRLSAKSLYQEFTKSVQEHDGGTPTAGLCGGEL